MKKRTKFEGEGRRRGDRDGEEDDGGRRKGGKKNRKADEEGIREEE